MKTILVVDDEPAVANVAIALLEDEGFRVLVASNGIEGLQKLSEERTDLIITDFMMPFMDGATMSHQIRGDPAHQHVPIIVVSAMTEGIIKRQFSSYEGFLLKPYRIAALLDLVTKLLDAQRPK
jgi:CheY-like chemotaxis protein